MTNFWNMYLVSLYKEYNLSISDDKCIFDVDSIEYLGHIIGENTQYRQNQASLNQSSMQCMDKEQRSPKDKEQLRSFLGACEYLSKFIEHFASKVAPLRELLEELN